MPPLVGAFDAVVDCAGCEACRDSVIGALGAGRDDAREAAVGALEMEGVRRAGVAGAGVGAGVEGAITPSDSVTGFGAVEGSAAGAGAAEAPPSGRSMPEGT